MSSMAVSSRRRTFNVGGTYKDRAANALFAIKDRKGTSVDALRKYMLLEPKQYRFLDAALIAGVKEGLFVKQRGRFKLAITKAKKKKSKICEAMRRDGTQCVRLKQKNPHGKGRLQFCKLHQKLSARKKPTGSTGAHLDSTTSLATREVPDFVLQYAKELQIFREAESKFDAAKQAFASARKAFAAAKRIFKAAKKENKQAEKGKRQKRKAAKGKKKKKK